VEQIYKVAIVGAGSIGALKPPGIDEPDGVNILTHAHAVFHHPKTKLVAVVDTNLAKADEAAEKWNVDPLNAFSGIDEMMNRIGECPDIIICATPTKTHYEMLSKILNLSPKLIIAEKPFCSSFDEANNIHSQSFAKGIDGQRRIPVMVDYIRRFATGYSNFKIMINSGAFGKALNCRVLYTRGLVHEGSHAIDLMHWFFGTCIDSYIELRDVSVPKERYIVDRDGNDPSVYASFEFEKCRDVVFQPCDGRKYGIFEIDICFEKNRFRFIDNGLFLEVYPITEMNEWGQKSLSYKLTEVLRRETQLQFALYNLICAAVNFLDSNGKTDLLCDIYDAIEVHKILEDIRI